MENNNKKQSELRQKLMGRLDKENVKSTGDIISAYELKEVLTYQLAYYNDLFFNQIEKSIAKFNKKQNRKFFDKKRIYIKKIIPTIKDGRCYLDIILCAGDGFYVGRILFNDDYTTNIVQMNEDYREAFNKNIFEIHEKFYYYVINLLEFKESNENLDYRWDKFNHNKDDEQILDDGFIKIKMHLNDIPYVFANFSSEEDFLLAAANNYDLFEYLEFYNNDILKKTEVNINDLNPLYRRFVEKTLFLGKPRTLEK